MSSLADVRIGQQTPTLLHLPANRERNVGADLLELADIGGVPLDPWQADALMHAGWMQRRQGSQGQRWSAREVLIDVTRQNGKGNVKLVRQLGGLFLFDERLQVHTAHEYKTTYEHFRKLADVIESTPDFSRRLKPRTGITTGSQNQAIELRNGQRIRFVARSGSSGRGLTGDVVYFDEAFALLAPMVGALMYALRAKPNHQIWYTSSAPHLGSEVLHALRARAALSTEDEPRLLAMCWNNPAGTDPGNREAWYRVNPALGLGRLTEETIEAEYRGALVMPSLMTEFCREALGIPEEPGVTDPIIPTDVWRARADTGSQVVKNPVYGLSVNPDRDRASTALSGANQGNLTHVEVVGTYTSPGNAVADLAGRTVAVDPSSPAGSLIGDLQRAGCTVLEVSGRQWAQACGAFYDDVIERRLVHVGQAVLDDALAGARKRVSGDAWVWDRRAPGVDITPLDAVTLARWGLVGLDEPADWAY